MSAIELGKTQLVANRQSEAPSFFRLHVLDLEKLGLAEGASRGEVEKKNDGHVLAKVETMGLRAVIRALRTDPESGDQ